MKALLRLVACVFAACALGAAPPPPRALVSASCTPANKPGRIRCRAVIELPLDVSSKYTLSWGEMRVVAAPPSVTPLRGRLGPLDADARDDTRLAWTFSVAVSEVGDRTFTLRLLASIEARVPASAAKPSAETAPIAWFDQRLEVPVRVAP